MDTADFDYELPSARIAQHPVEPRDSSRLLVDLGSEHGIDHRHVRDLPDQLAPGDLLVINTTRVLPARLHLVKEGTGGAAEVLLLERRDGDDTSGAWEALVRPGKRVPAGSVLVSEAGGGALRVEVGDDLGDGVRRVRVTAVEGDLDDLLARFGEMPLPPYIKAELADPERYQTVYADPERADSSAAPTAGLHLTAAVLDQARTRGVTVVDVDLVVGLGTFRPIDARRVEDHRMHRERYRVPDGTLEACHRTRAAGGRVVAVGTTTVRALESAAATGELEGHTDLFISRGFEFKLVDRLLTNFHQPRSSLLVMIDAFLGDEADGSPRWRTLYEEALAGDYRFLSFGDAMLLTRHDRWTSS